MSWTLLRGTLHQNRVSIFWFSFGLVLYSWMMTWFYPEIGGDQYAELVETMPVEVSRSSGARRSPSRRSEGISRWSTWGSCGW